MLVKIEIKSQLWDNYLIEEDCTIIAEVSGYQKCGNSEEWELNPRVPHFIDQFPIMTQLKLTKREKAWGLYVASEGEDTQVIVFGVRHIKAFPAPNSAAS